MCNWPKNSKWRIVCGDQTFGKRDYTSPILLNFVCVTENKLRGCILECVDKSFCLTNGLKLTCLLDSSGSVHKKLRQKYTRLNGLSKYKGQNQKIAGVHRYPKTLGKEIHENKLGQTRVHEVMKTPPPATNSQLFLNRAGQTSINDPGRRKEPGRKDQVAGSDRLYFTDMKGGVHPKGPGKVESHRNRMNNFGHRK